MSEGEAKEKREKMDLEVSLLPVLEGCAPDQQNPAVWTVHQAHRRHHKTVEGAGDPHGCKDYGQEHLQHNTFVTQKV